jgi:hypothetical protein
MTVLELIDALREFPHDEDVYFVDSYYGQVQVQYVIAGQIGVVLSDEPG